MSENKHLLNEDFRVILQIFEASRKKKEKVTLSKLLDSFEGRISESRISESLDRLFDEGILSAKFQKINNKWARVFYISGEAETFVQNIYNQTVKT